MADTLQDRRSGDGQRRPTYQPTITLGQLLNILTILGGIAVAWQAFADRLGDVEGTVAVILARQEADKAELAAAVDRISAELATERRAVVADREAEAETRRRLWAELRATNQALGKFAERLAAVDAVLQRLERQLDEADRRQRDLERGTATGQRP